MRVADALRPLSGVLVDVPKRVEHLAATDLGASEVLLSARNGDEREAPAHPGAWVIDE